MFKVTFLLQEFPSLHSTLASRIMDFPIDLPNL